MILPRAKSGLSRKIRVPRNFSEQEYPGAIRIRRHDHASLDFRIAFRIHRQSLEKGGQLRQIVFTAVGSDSRGEYASRERF